MDKELYYDFNKVGKTTLEKNKRLEAQSKQYLQEYYQKLNDEKKAEEDKKLNEALSSARFGYASTYTRSKNRVNSLKEEIRYTNTSTTIAMTEMVAQVVEKALLLDEAEYSKLNPEYKTEIRDIVRGLLENGNVNEVITNEDTLNIIEHVANTLPDVKNGKYLLEDQIMDLMKIESPAKVEASIDSLSGNVAKRVANLVEAEKKKVEEIEADVEKAVGKNNRKEQPKPQVEEEMVEELPEEEVPTEEEVVEEQPMEDEVPVEGEEVEAQPAGKTIHIDPDGTTSISMPNGQLALNGDGSMDIQLMENTLVRETPRCGLLESLAVNEAHQMIVEGKEYNPDLAIANAITYITIIESLDELGLISVDRNTYGNIINNAGGNTGEKGVCIVKESKPLNEAVICSQQAPILNKSNPNDLAERIRQRRLSENNNSNLLHD